MDYRGDRGRRGEERQGGRLKKGSRRQRKGAIERHIGKRCEMLGRGWTIEGIEEGGERKDKEGNSVRVREDRGKERLRGI